MEYFKNSVWIMREARGLVSRRPLDRFFAFCDPVTLTFDHLT